MFERFTERARQVVVLAQDEARSLGHGHIGTEHLLLGVLREEEGIGARALASLGIGLAAAREHVVRLVGRGEVTPTGQMPFTAEAKRSLELSLREALALGHDFIGTEHLLLGLLRDRDGGSVEVLRASGFRQDDVRARVLELLGGAAPGATPWRAALSPPPARRDWLPAVAAGIFLAVGLAVGLLLGWAIWG